jgi:GT2 family glycosyltransferase
VHYRCVLRALGYWQLGKHLLSEAKAAEALDQFRHVFTTVRGPLPCSVFHLALLSDMARCYRALGDEHGATRCDQEQNKCVYTLKTRPPEISEKKKDLLRHGAAHPEISVVLPTFNRSEILRLCLAALAFQTLPAERWEAVIVDDGSTDDTAALCQQQLYPFRLKYVVQENRGAGAARRKGVETAQGEFLLLCNDDTIASSNLLVEHLSVHRKRKREKIAVLGEFRPSQALGQRALSLFVNTSIFFFPQSTLKAGQSYDRAYFMTCNLSVRRDIVLQAGNFDPTFRVSEDSELGTRLMAQGLRVVYHPAAVAWHEHTQFTAQDLVLRAQAYGSATWDLFKKHPQLLRKDKGPYGLLAREDEARLQAQVDRYRLAVDSARSALEALDQMDFHEVWTDQVNGPKAAKELMDKVGQLVTIVYWFFVYQRFLERWHEDRAPSAVAARESEPELQVQRR